MDRLADTTGSVSDLGDQPLLVERLMSLCALALPPSSSARFEDSMVLTCNAFSCIVRASHLSSSFWNALRGRKDVISLVRRLLLEDHRGRLRSYIGDTIGVLGHTSFAYVVYRSFSGQAADSISRSTGENDTDVAIYFWRILCQLLPEVTNDEKAQCAELFDATLKLLLTISEFLGKDIDCQRCFDGWAQLLVEHEHDEVCRVILFLVCTMLTRTRWLVGTLWITSFTDWPGCCSR